MADKYNPGMEFQSWRSLPRLTDALDSGSMRAWLLGAGINALTGVNPTEMAQKTRQDMRQPAIPNVPVVDAQPVPVVPPAMAPIEGQPVSPVNPVRPVTLPPLGQPIETEGSIFDELNGLRK